MFRFANNHSLRSATVADTRLFRLLAGILTPLAVVLGLLLLPQIALAGGTVSTCDEASLDTALAGGGLVTFSCGPATIVVTSPKVIYSDTTIDGGGVITISGGGITRVLEVNNGATLKLTNIVIANGQASTGGGILNSGRLVLDSVQLHDNTALAGGAIRNNGILSMTRSTIANSGFNVASGTGGGILNDNLSTAEISNSSIMTNAAFTGGGIANYGSLTLTNSTINGNSMAGIYDIGTLVVGNSTFRGNTIQNGAGGGLGVVGWGSATLTNVTFFENRADYAGAIFVNEGYLSVFNSSLVSNTASSGTNVAIQTGNAVIQNTIIALGTYSNCGGTLISLGHNLSNDNTCGFTASGDITNTDPLLGPLQDNGGQTWTMMPLPGSPLINAGDNAGCPATDQRGVTRPQGPACEIGAFEVRVPTVSSINPTTATAFSPPLALSLTGTNFVSGSLVLLENTPLASGFVNSTLLTATIPSNLLTAGVLTVTVSNPSPEAGIAVPSLPFTVSKASQMLTFAVLPDRTYGDPDFDPGASASSGLTVTYIAISHCTVSGSSVHLTGAGSCAIGAQQPGDVNYNPATSITQTFSVTKANQSITFTQPLSPAMYGATFAVTPTANSGLPVNVAASGACTVLGGAVTITGSTGICTLTASQPGDVNYNEAVPVVRDVAAIKASQAITFGPPADRAIGDPPFAITGTATSGLAVDFTAGGACAVLSNTVTLSAVGSCTLTAHQPGDANYDAAPAVAHGFTITDAMLYLPLVAR